MSRTVREPDYYYNNECRRDKKPWYKPDSKFKQPKKKSRRAKENAAFRTGREIPIFRHTNEWEYT